MTRKLFVALLVMALAVPAAARIIDDFTFGAGVLGLENLPIPYTVNQTYTGPDNAIIGGERAVTFQKLAGDLTGPYVQYDTTPPGRAFYNSTAGHQAVWTMQYGATVDLNANLTLGNATGIIIEGLVGNLAAVGAVQCDVELVTNGFPVTQTISLQFDGNYHIPFSNFLGIVPTDVDQITVTITTDPVLNDAATFSIQTIGSGPPDGPIATVPTTFGAVKTLFR